MALFTREANKILDYYRQQCVINNKGYIRMSDIMKLLAARQSLIKGADLWVVSFSHTIRLFSKRGKFAKG